jgi:hypothetical protein
MQKILLLLATVLALPPALALGQTTEELNSDGKNPENVLTQSMGLDRKSYSPLAQINKSNIKRLVPIWSTSLMNESGELAVSRRFLGGQTPAKADKRIRSKWSRWMRYAADHKLTSG